MQEITTSIVLTGTDKTKERALINAISGLQQKVSKKHKGIIIRIEPLEFKFLEGEQQIRREKFMFFFWGRDVNKFTVKIEITARVVFIDVEEFDFEVNRLTSITSKF